MPAWPLRPARKPSNCFLRVVLFDDGVADVRAVEAGEEDARFDQAEAGEDFVLASPGRRWRSARCAGRPGSARAGPRAAGTPGGNRGPIARRNALRRWRTGPACRLRRAHRAWPACGRAAGARGRCRRGRALPLKIACSTACAARQSSVELRQAALTPSWISASTWSCISAISGETTTAQPGRSRAGIW